MVQAKRLRHIRGTEEEAVRLAQRWGADPEVMRRAAILHDCTKYFTLEEHLAICDRYGILLDDLERSGVKLLHAKSGAALARYVFGQTETVYRAISYHTTGRASMSLEEKILYMADYMEPNRDFDGVEEMRRLAYEDLDRAILMGAHMCIADMQERGQVVHHNTQEACDWLEQQQKEAEEREDKLEPERKEHKPLLTAKELITLAVQALDSKKGKDIKVLYTADQTTLADYFVIATGTSTTQIKALADAVEERMTQHGEEPHHVEGHRGGQWTLLDYSAIIVHVFTEEAREFYDLERLWSDATPVELSEFLPEQG